MTRSQIRFSAMLMMAAALAACATTQGPERDKDQAAYFDAAYNDHNRAPASMSPPKFLTEGTASVDPTSIQTQADYHFSMGEAFSLEGNREKAIEAFKLTLVYDPESSAVRMRLATEYVKAGYVSEAIEQAEEAVQRAPKSLEAHMLLGGLYSTMHAYDKAAIHYEQVLKIDPTNSEAPLYLGAVWSEQKQYDRAVKSFESLAKNPDYPTPHLAWYYIGRVRMDQKEERATKAAEKAFQKALTLKPDHVDSVLALSSIYNKRKDEKKAMEFLAHWQKEEGPNARVAEILAQVYIEKTQYDEAYEQLEILEHSGDDPLSARLRMALILIERKMYDQATAKLEDILRDAPESDKVRFYLGAVYEESKKNEKAISHFKKVPVDSQYFEESVIHAAYLLKAESHLDEAILLVEKGLASKKDRPQMYAMYASLLDEKGDFKKASTSLEGALEKFPDSAQLRFYYGTVQDHMGHKDVVITEMKKVIELDPNHVQGLNYLAFTWAEEDKNLEEAEKLARRATQLDPEDGYVLDTLGWIVYKKGENKEAIKWLEAAQRAQPTVGVIAEHLGDAYMKSSMVEKAVTMYNRALKLETDMKKIQELKSKISAADDQRPLKNRDQVRVPASE